MTDIKRPPTPSSQSAGGLHGHAKRDFYRGVMTKNIVKGAGGGARGVDFQDFEAENKDKEANAPKGQQSHASSGAKRKSALQEKQAQEQSGGTPENILQEMAAASHQNKVDSTVQEVESQEQKQKKKKPQPQASQQDSDNPSQEAVEQAGAHHWIPDENEVAHEASILANVTKLLQDPTTERQAYGLLALTDPEQMKKTLGTPVRVAKHLLVLSSRMMERGQPREEVLGYLTSTFLALGPDFGKRAFRDFSLNIGIGVVYPLEIRERLLRADEGFLPTTKCRFTASRRIMTAQVKETIVVEYPEDMTITEFAVKGGLRKGYVLAPLKEKGKHGLRFFEPGEYKVLIMGHDPLHFERMEELTIQVSGVGTVKPVPVVTASRPGGFSFDRVKRNREAAGGSGAPRSGGETPQGGGGAGS